MDYRRELTPSMWRLTPSLKLSLNKSRNKSKNIRRPLTTHYPRRRLPRILSSFIFRRRASIIKMQRDIDMTPSLNLREDLHGRGRHSETSDTDMLNCNIIDMVFRVLSIF
jgi:hypothetical protein